MKAENSQSELDLPIWAVVHTTGVIAINKTYNSALVQRQLANNTGMFNGLCITTNDAAARMFKDESI